MCTCVCLWAWVKERENEAESEMRMKTGGVNCDRIPEMTVLKIGNENSITHMHSACVVSRAM